jgi:hypothetical protein
VVVPHGHERKPGSRILQVRIVQVHAIELAIVREARGDVKALRNLLAVLIANQVAELAIVALTVRRILGIVDDLVDEVAEVQHEGELIGRRRALVFEDHAPIGIERAFAGVLAAHECESDRTVVAGSRCGARAADAAALAVARREPVPIDPRGLQSADQHTAGVVRRRGRIRAGCRDDVLERLVFGDFDGERHDLRFALERHASPQNDAVGRRISRSDSLGEQIASLLPRSARAPRIRRRPSN